VRDIELARMKKVQAYLAIRGALNASENSDVPNDSMALYSRCSVPSSITASTKPAGALALAHAEHGPAASMSTEAFENLYFDVCTMDYAKMARAMLPLERRMKKADKVHITAPGTDLRF
jgi:aminopeptidase